jgi:hypothetical protein
VWESGKRSLLSTFDGSSTESDGRWDEIDRRPHRTADPENQLVTAELDRRWKLALQHVHEIDERIHQHSDPAEETMTGTGQELQQLVSQLEDIGTDVGTSARLKKRIVRTLIEEVLVDVDVSLGELLLTIHWKGGVHTELRLPSLDVAVAGPARE